MLSLLLLFVWEIKTSFVKYKGIDVLITNDKQI